METNERERIHTITKGLPYKIVEWDNDNYAIEDSGDGWIALTRRRTFDAWMPRKDIETMYHRKYRVCL
jgi:hypothetical protein